MVYDPVKATREINQVSADLVNRLRAENDFTLSKMSRHHTSVANAITSHERPESTMNDPTYNSEAIKSNPAWELAFTLSEIDNDNAPIGWSRYLPMAQNLLNNYEIKRKDGR